MKFVESYNNWKNLHLLIESIVNIDSDIMSIIKQYQNSSNPSFSAIANKIISVVGKDFPKNRYDLISISDDMSSYFTVTMGRQVNSITIAKVISNLLALSGIDPNAPIPKEEIENLMKEKEISEQDAKKEINKSRLIKQDTIQKFADELVGVIKINKEKNNVTTANENDGYKIVSGDDIIKYYSSEMINKTYMQNGVEEKYERTELIQSCMVNKQEHLKIYALNPEKIKLVIKLVNGKVDARALLWKLSSYDDDDGYDYYLDRVYFNKAEDRSAMISWAKENVGGTLLDRSEWQRNYVPMRVELENVIDGINLYPYIDTFNYLYIKKEEDKLINQGFLLTEDIDFDDYIGFNCQDTTGKRIAIDSKNKRFENNLSKEVVVGSKIEYNIEGEFQDLEMLKKYYSMSYDTLLKIETRYDQFGYWRGLPNRSGLAVAQELLVPSPPVGGIEMKVPKFGVILIRDVSDVLEQNPTIKTKLDGEFSYVDFRSLYDYFNYGSTWRGDYNRIEFKFLTDLDCRILGINDLVKNQKPMYFPHEFIYDDYGDDIEMNRKYSVLEYLFKTKEKEKLFDYKNAISEYWYRIEKEDILKIIKDRIKPVKTGLTKRFKDFIGFEK